MWRRGIWGTLLRAVRMQAGDARATNIMHEIESYSAEWILYSSMRLRSCFVSCGKNGRKEPYGPQMSLERICYKISLLQVSRLPWTLAVPFQKSGLLCSKVPLSRFP
jgi:hypothetical protein